MTRDERYALKIFNEIGVIVAGHFVFTGGNHSSQYINKDALYPHTHYTSRLCRLIAREFSGEEIDTVIGPEKGGIILSQWVAEHLTDCTGEKVFAVYAEKTKDNNFAINRGYDKFIAGRLVLVVEDTLTTGGSVREVVELVHENGGSVVGVGALWNRGGVTAENIGDVPRLFSLVNKKLDDWPKEECPLCAQGVPINTDIGKGEEFLSRRANSG